MKRMSRLLTVLVLTLVLTGLVPSGAVGAPEGASGAPEGASEIAPARPVSIVISSNVIGTKMRKISISGAGFTPGSIVTVGIPGLPANEGITNARDIWFGVVTVNKYQAFNVSVNLRRTLWRLKKILAKEERSSGGIYTVMAKNDLDEIATAPLVINLKKAKKKAK